VLCQRTHWPAHKASCAAAVAAGSGGGASTTQAGGRAGTPAAETLLQAAKVGDVAEVRKVVALGVNVDERDADGDTALHWAAGNGHVEVLQVLVVELGADKEAKTANGQTALHWAVVNGHMEVMRVLVELGADKDAKDVDGCTPLHDAAFNGHVEAIKALEQLGAQIDVQAANGDTPLKLCIRHGHHQAAQVLKELERTARTGKAAATSERGQQATEQAETQSKVRGVELPPVFGVSDAVSLAHGWVVSSEVPAAGFLWRR
jgi:hypothetical protein